MGCVMLLALAGCSSDEDKSSDTTAKGAPSTTADGGATSTTEESPDATVEPVSAIPTVEVEAADHTFTIPEDIESGWTEFVMSNTGAEVHHMQIARLNEGVTMEDLGGALESGDEGAAMAMVTMVGGPGVAEPGSESSATVELEPGLHVALCFLTDAEGVPHLALGMIQPFEVTENDEVVDPPEIDGEIVLADYSFELPEDFSGSGTYRVVNNGAEPHEAILVRVNDDATPETVESWMAEPMGPPPFSMHGGMQGLGPDGVGYLSLDLPEGSYMAICSIPDADGVPHTAHGMIAQFEVGEA